MLLTWTKDHRRIILASLGMLMLFCTSPENIKASDTATKQADSLIAQAHRIAPLISAKDLAELMTSDQPVLLIDVRSEIEFAGGHLKNARLMPRSILEFAVRDGQLGLDDNNIVLYCRSGNRSALAVKDLMDLGFTNIKHLDGGFKAWFDAGYSFFNDHGELTGISFEAAE